MALTLIANLDPGLQCRNTLNAVIDLVGANHPWTAGSIPFTNAGGDYAQNNANFFWDDSNSLLTSGNGLKVKGATSGVVTLNTKAVAGTWTITLPDSAGTSGHVLSTDGAGVTSWIAAGGGGGMAIGGAITGGTAGRVLFAGAGGILDDDSTFTWNDTLKDLAIGGTYYVNAARGLYMVPTAGSNSWFEGNAGNQTLTGAGNFGTGDLALSAMTSGTNNVAIGANAMLRATTASDNLALGSSSLLYTLSDPNNVAVGRYALQTLGYLGAGGGGNYNNIAIGFNSLGNAQQGYYNVVLGYAGLQNIGGSTVAAQNTVIGAAAANAWGASGGASVAFNTIIGSDCGANITGGSNNTWIGSYRGPSAVVTRTVVLAGGDDQFVLDCNLLTANVWSFQMRANTESSQVHIYKMQSPSHSTTNYERIWLGWEQYGSYPNAFRLSTEAGGSGVKGLVAIDGFAKAGAPANTDLPSATFTVIDDTSAGQTWLVFNKAGTIRKVQLT